MTSNIIFIFSDFWFVSAVLQNAISALDCLVKPISSHTTLFNAYRLNFLAIGYKIFLAQVSVKCPIKLFLDCKVRFCCLALSFGI